jgi:hypothetical protein
MMPVTATMIPVPAAMVVAVLVTAMVVAAPATAMLVGHGLRQSRAADGWLPAFLSDTTDRCAASDAVLR